MGRMGDGDGKGGGGEGGNKLTAVPLRYFGVVE